MKTKEEIEQLVEKLYFHVDGFEEEIYEGKRHFIAGYTQCQEDMKPLLEDLFSLWQSLAEVGEISVGKNFTKKHEELKSKLNKQD
jgi:hypothetical protein